MNSNRMGRVDSEIQTALSHTLTYDMQSPELEGVMISVVSCHTTNDLKHCKVLISIFPFAAHKITILPIWNGLIIYLATFNIL